MSCQSPKPKAQSLPAASLATRRRAGFTMFELVMVILIIGILTSIMIFSISGLAPIYRVRSTSRTIGAKIEELRALAIATGRPLGIRYNMVEETHTWQIIPPAPPEAPDEPIENRRLGILTELPTGVHFRRVSIPGVGAYDRRSVNIMFSPMGNTGSHVVTLEGETKDGKPIILSVKFNAITGSIDFIDGEAEFEHHEG
jgi:prepilin-type N-terminal cleavage/methylation domain-containing protein